MPSALPVERARADFPILKRMIHGSPLVYLDSAATTQKPQIVIDTIAEYYRQTNANVHRGVYALSAQATDLYEKARGKVAAFIGAEKTDQIIFTRNTTEAINLVAYSWGLAHLQTNDEILLTEMEHHSNLVPWYLVAPKTGAVVRHLPIHDDGTLALERWKEFFTPKTRIVAVAHTSNVLGTINPIASIAARAHAAGALVLLDAAQGVPHAPFDVVALDADFVAFSAHKMLGPTGVGVLYGRRELLEGMDPFLGGGDMIRTVTLQGATWNDLPWKFEAGTPNIAGVIGFGAAIDYLSALGMDKVRRHEMELTDYALARMNALDSVDVYGPADATARAGVIAFNHRRIHPHDLATILDRRGIAIRAGHHCAQPLMERLGQSATARASFYVYNTRDEVDALIEGLIAAGKFFERNQ
ncbi:MAG: cysteine desulfurase [candidate division Zixibacteria bacterium]|nr:cysteine desulfurase [candidate division Zixibacteria bacterium]